MRNQKFVNRQRDLRPSDINARGECKIKLGLLKLQLQHRQPPYRARARPRIPAAPARPRETPVAAAASSEEVLSGAPDVVLEGEPEDEAVSEPVAVADVEEPVSTVVDSVVAPEEEASVVVVPVAVAVVEPLAPELVASAETEEKNEGYSPATAVVTYSFTLSGRLLYHDGQELEAMPCSTWDRRAAELVASAQNELGTAVATTARMELGMPRP